MENKEIIMVLESLRDGHYYCEDSWYSCPMAEDGCSDDRQGTACNCGATKQNQIIDETIARLSEKPNN